MGSLVLKVLDLGDPRVGRLARAERSTLLETGCTYSRGPMPKKYLLFYLVRISGRDSSAEAELRKTDAHC